MSNGFVEILLGAAINNTSIININKQIKTIQDNIKDLDVSLNVKSSPSDSKVFTHMEQQITKLQNKIKELENSLNGIGKDNSNSGNPFRPTEEGAKKALKSVMELEEVVRKSNGKIKIVDDSSTGNIKEVVTTIKNELGQIEKKTYRASFDVDNKSVQGFKELTKVTNDSSFNELNKKLIDAKNKLAELGRQGQLSGKNFKVLEKDLDNAFTTTEIDKVLSKMKQLNQVATHDNKWSNATKNLNDQSKGAITTLEKLKQSASSLGLDTKQFDVLISKMRSMSNIEFTNDAQITKANNAFSKLSSQMSALKNDTMSFETAFKKFNTILDTVEHSGILGADALNKLRMKAMSLNDVKFIMADRLSEIRKETELLNNQLSATKRNNEIQIGTQKARNEIEKLNAQLTKTINSYKRTINMEDADAIRSKLQGMGTNMPSFTNTSDIKKYMADLKQVELQIKRMNAEATVGARNSMSVIDSFKVAMEKFPIWMASSTIFFGSIRTAREFVTTLIDIDSKLVSISKVMSDDMDMEKVFDRATLSAEKFGQSISQALDAYIEFARQGYKGDDLGYLADAGLVAANVGELTAQKASEYMTATMVQWGIDAENSMQTIDSWNAISNNYATTVEKLAQGQARAGATAKALGMDFNQLNAVIGTVKCCRIKIG